jgi:hypothetical protein
VVRPLERRENRRARIGWKRRRLAVRIGNATNREEIVLDPVVSRGERTAVTLDAVLLEN